MHLTMSIHILGYNNHVLDFKKWAVQTAQMMTDRQLQGLPKSMRRKIVEGLEMLSTRSRIQDSGLYDACTWEGPGRRECTY